MLVDHSLSASALLDQLLEEAGKQSLWFVKDAYEPDRFETGRAILALGPQEQAAFVVEAVTRHVNHLENCGLGGSYAVKALLNRLLRKKLPFTAAALERLVRTLAQALGSRWWEMAAPGGIMRAVENFVADHGLPDGLRAALQDLLALPEMRMLSTDTRTVEKKIQALLSPPAGPGAHFALTTDEAWTGYLRQALASLEMSARAGWDALLAHCNEATGSKPSGKWLRQAGQLVENLGSAAFAEILEHTLAEVGKPGGLPPAPINALGFFPDPTQVHDTHSNVLRGLVWCVSLVETDAAAAALGAAADVCFKKLPGIGPRAPKIGNACLWALSNLSSPAAIAQLGRLKTRTKHASSQKQLAKALDTAAGKTGMSTEELEEVAVPTCGLTAVGHAEQTLGDYSARLEVTDRLKVELTWRRADGKVQSGVPAAVKTACAAELKALKRQEKEIAQQLPAQRDRLERLVLEQRSWSLADFRARVLDHPLVGTLARRLIWRYSDDAQSAEGIWHEGRIVDVHGRPLEGVGAATRVALWHPLHAAVEQVEAWRDWLEAQQVRQPFKQAYREIYLLTDAERETTYYSRRFAGHLIKQHQFSALCHQRGWRYTLQGAWDSANTPERLLPRWDLRAEFVVEPVREEDQLLARGDLTDRMVFLCLTTGLVRFIRAEGVLPIALADVPPLVFSEVMRDLDLFVGVASVGNDPHWIDGRPAGQQRDAWTHASFGDLFPTGQTRRAVLQRLLPRLTIADRCALGDRFLVVRGDLRTYKIHLGSGNILMAPNDQYLCIVPKLGAGGPNAARVFLPFEGDETLAIILSKAFLLADDARIKDPTIRSQIEARHGVPVG